MALARSLRPWVARLGVCALVVLGTGLVAAPAHADEAYIFAYAGTSDIKLPGAGSPGKTVTIYAVGANTINPRVTFDLTGLAGVATVDFPSTCTAAGAAETCPVAGGPTTDTSFPIVLHAAPGAVAGTTGTFTLVASADNVPAGYPFPNTVTIVDGVDLVASEPAPGPFQDAKPGDELSVPVAFSNAGNQPAAGFQITMLLDHDLLLDRHRDCTFADDGTRHVVTCTFQQTVAPGQAVRIDDFSLTIARDGYGFGGVDVIVKPLDPVTDIDESNNFGFFAIKVLNTIDLATIGAKRSGGAGDIVPVKIGVVNNGPGSLDNTRAGEPARRYVFTVPDDTEVVQAPLDCAGIVVEPDGTQQGYPGRAGLTFYRCDTSIFLGVQDRSTVQFQLKINQVIPGVTGTVSFHDPYAVPPDPPPDTDPSNDTALVVINPIDVD